MDTVYVHIRHWQFWYGQYGFCDKSCNDEITIYSDKEQNIELGYFEITTRACLKYYLDNEIDRLENKEYYNEIAGFLESKDDIYYSCIYPRDEEDILDQVKHFAPTNEKGHKPVYIDMWCKLLESLDMNEIKKIVKILGKEFLHENIVNVEILDVPTYEEAKVSYEEDFAPYVK